MMDNRKKIALLIISIAVLILVIIVILFLKKVNPEISEPTSVSPGSSSSTLVVSEIVVMPTSTPGDRPRNFEYDPSNEAPRQVNDNDAAQMAKLFATRFGSFSNHSDYSNVTDLKIFMTDSMSAWADKYVKDLREQEYTGEYYGVTTYPLTTKVLNYDEGVGKAKVEVITRRQESKGDVLGFSYQQKMTLDLIKVNNEWLVDNAVWQK